MDLNEIYKRKNEFATRVVGGELILVPVKSNVADMTDLFILNEVGLFIWENIDGKHNLTSLTEAITENFDIDHETALKDLNTFLQKMKENLFKF